MSTSLSLVRTLPVTATPSSVAAFASSTTTGASLTGVTSTVTVAVSTFPSSSVAVMPNDPVPLKFRAGVNDQLPAASIDAVPPTAVTPPSIMKFGVESPSAASANVAVPVTAGPSSGPMPVKPPNVPRSLTAVTVMFTVPVDESPEPLKSVTV